MDMNEYNMIMMSRKQTIIVLQALDALIDDAEWFNVIDSVNVDHGGDMINIRTINEFDVCEEHVDDLQRSQRRLDQLEHTFDAILQSDEVLSTWARSTIAMMLHNIDRDDDIDDMNKINALGDDE
jgi:hypothetical protein